MSYAPLYPSQDTHNDQYAQETVVAWDAYINLFVFKLCLWDSRKLLSCVFWWDYIQPSLYSTTCQDYSSKMVP